MPEKLPPPRASAAAPVLLKSWSMTISRETPSRVMVSPVGGASLPLTSVADTILAARPCTALMVMRESSPWAVVSSCRRLLTSETFTALAPVKPAATSAASTAATTAAPLAAFTVSRSMAAKGPPFTLMEKPWAPAPATKLIPPLMLELPTVRADVVPEKSVPSVEIVPATMAGTAVRTPSCGAPDRPALVTTRLPMMDEGRAVASRFSRVVTRVVAWGATSPVVTRRSVSGPPPVALPSAVAAKPCRRSPVLFTI